MGDLGLRTLQNREELVGVPDGTIISWYRIKGDLSSEAVAFVRQAMEYPGIREDQEAGIREQPERITWISPGGWDPMSIEDAGVNFPAVVIRWGDVTMVEERWAFQPPPEAIEIPLPPEIQQLTAWPEPLQSYSLVHGGTWAREAALAASARFWAGQSVGSDRWVDDARVITTAETFEQWLDRLPDAPPQEPDRRDLLDAVSRDLVCLADRLVSGRNAIREAQEFYGLAGVSEAFLDRMTRTASKLYHQAGFTP